MSSTATSNQRVKQLLVLTLITFGLLSWLVSVTTHAAPPIVVTTAADNGDNANPTPGSLRQAIITANTTPGADTIIFQIGSGLQTIVPLSQLPTVTDPVVIDGTTQPGFGGSPMIELNGSSTVDSYGLFVTAGNSVIRGLVINRFRRSAIYIKENGNNVVAGNYIGTNAGGTDKYPSPNNGIGIFIESSNNTIGGTTAADRNVIAGNVNPNGSMGIAVSTKNAKNNKIIGNYIGTDATGTKQIGHGNSGVWLVSSSEGTIVGGPTSAERNVIAGNPAGVDITASNNNKVWGNYFGTKADGTGFLPNYYGVYIEVDSTGNWIGGTNPGEGNLILNSGNHGVVVNDGCVGNSVLGNSIAFSSKLGIDLNSNGVTPNDANDADAGGNNLQNYPVLTSVVNNAGSTVISGTLNSESSKPYRIELFANTFCGSSGFGEGQFFVTSTNVNTDGAGDASFTVSVPTASLKGSVFTATATDSVGSTSEFSQCKSTAAASAGALQFGSNLLIFNESAGTASAIVTRTNGSAGAVTVNYATANIAGSAEAGKDYVAKSGQLTFANGETSKQIDVQLTNDSESEPNEYFQIKLSNPTGGATLGQQSSVDILIGDNDGPEIKINDVQVTEGNSGTANATFNVSLSNPTYQTVTVSFATQMTGTATSGVDYEPASGTVTFAIGETSKPVTVLVKGDSSPESNETFFVQLSNNDHATIGNYTGTGTIIDDDSPMTVQFSQPSYGVQENQPTADIAVTRSGDVSAAASVDYRTSDNSGTTPCQSNGNGVASERCDYATQAGTLRFAAGETTKTIQIPIINDAYVETDEVFNVTLSNAKGMAMGATSTSSVTITSDDTQLALINPIDDQAFFIRMQYVDFLGRVAEQGGFEFWMNRMNSCPAGQTCDRTDTSQRFFQSDEFQERGFYVYRLYDAVLGRLPQYNEFVPDMARLNGFQNPQEQQQSKNEYLQDFINRAEFKTLYGQYLSADGLIAIDATGFVNALCNKAGITPSVKQTLINELQSNAKDPAHILEDFILSPEISGVGTKFYDRGFITMQYFGYLRRDPDAAGFQFWQGKVVETNHDYRFMVSGFINSDEYRFRLALISAMP
jgi:hypothetical protein